MLEFQTPPPRITGSHCAKLLAQEFWHGGECVSPANVLYIQTDDESWHRIAIDSGVVFWRVETTPSVPGASDDPGEYGSHPLVDIGERHKLLGRRLESVDTVDASDASEMHFRFDDGRSLVLIHRRDVDATSLEIRAPAA